MTERSAAIVRSCVDQLIQAGFEGVLLIAANPVDLMSRLAFERSGLPAAQVIGTGALLDSIRLQRALASRLGVAASAIDAMVLGEHGDSEVPVFSTVRVGGLTLDQFTGDGPAPDLGELGTEVRTAAYRIVSGKGYTSFGIATAIVRICEAILRDEGVVLPVSTLLRGEYGVSGLYLSVPCLITRGGVKRILVADLDEGDRQGLKASAHVLQDAFAAMEAAAPPA